MKFLATFGAFDSHYGNYLGHSFLLLSKAEEGKKIEIVDTWGFYGMPSTTVSILSPLKKLTGFDIDLQGNHGVLRHEEIRYLDVAVALHGVTFELTAEKFNELYEKCRRTASEQEAAIKEFATETGIKGKSDNIQVHALEEYSELIYKVEQIKAKEEKRSPRLHPFDARLTFTFWGPAFNTSRNCKSQMLSLLDGILTKTQIARLTEEGKHPTVPRYSGKMETLYLHSTGPLRAHTKSSGAVVYSRDWADADVKLFWTLPPQEIEVLEESTTNLFKVNPAYLSEAKKVIQQLQRLEWIFMNAAIPENAKASQTNLIQQIRGRYEAFSTPVMSTAKKVAQNLLNSYLFPAPKDKQEQAFIDNIQLGKSFVSDIYAAIIGDRTNDMPQEIEEIISHLTLEDKKEACKLMSRSYIRYSIPSIYEVS
jgi:hypothetical protein